MTKVEAHDPKLNGDKPTILVTPLSLDGFNIQFKEVFGQDHYKKGRYKKDMVIIDIGANMGLSALYFKDCAKVIYAIEPSAAHFTALAENTKDYPNIKIFNIAILGHNGKVKISSNAGDDIPESVFGNGKESEEVDCITLATFMDKLGIEEVDLLKVDAEGAEYPIFLSKDFKKIAPRIKRIIGESHFFEPFIPDYVIPILERVGFKARFTPGMKNMWKELRVEGLDSKKEDRYKVFFNTIFEARRAHV